MENPSPNNELVNLGDHVYKYITVIPYIMFRNDFSKYKAHKQKTPMFCFNFTKDKGKMY